LARPQDHRQGDAQHAAQRIHTAHGVFGIFQLCQDLAGPLQEPLPGRGQGQAPRGAQQQLDPEPCLQRADDAGDGRLRQVHIARVHIARGAAEAADFAHLQEDGQFLQPIVHLLNG